MSKFTVDGDTSPKSDCPRFSKGHIMQFDMGQSSPERSVYSCSCGALTVEHEDSGTGA